MDFSEIRAYALSLPHVTEEVKWEFDLSFCIAGKMFLVGDIREGNWVTLKVKPEEFELLLEHEGIESAPYLGRFKWINVSNLNMWTGEQWKAYIRQSYELVKAGLPKKARLSLEQ